MLFNSIDYVAFLCISVAVFWGLRRQALARWIWLFSVSCVFYLAWHPAYIVLILGSTLVDYLVGRALSRWQGVLWRQAAIAISLIANLGLLFTFKYFNFVASAVCDTRLWIHEVLQQPWLQALGPSSVSRSGFSCDPLQINVLLPVGISFYTFQTLSYTLDVARGKLEATPSLLRFGCFVTFFPQLVAGPIVRARDFLPQLLARPLLRIDEVGRGLALIGLGMVKKVAVADYLSVNLVDRVFESPERYSAAEVVVALYAFTAQIYCDFSGYTDVARGSAKLFGIHLPHNFDRPYWATNPADFWRRWHMTLSSWVRDYLYFPLGGSRCGVMRNYINLALTMFIIGIWHGASWTFVLYGALQAAAMVAHRFWVKNVGPRLVFWRTRVRGRDLAWLAHASKVVLCMQFVVFSRILFRATSLSNARAVLEAMGSGGLSCHRITASIWWVLLGSFALHYTPKSWFSTLEWRFARLPAPIQAGCLAGVGAIVALAATSETVPYIYFQF